MRYAFFPGCSLDINAAAYGDSVRAVSGALGVELVDVDDWNCCGATESWAREDPPTQALVARNLARVAPDLEQVTAPCAACYLNLKKVNPATLAIYYDNTETGQWEKMEAEQVIVNEKYGFLRIVDGQIPHFSRYAVAWSQ